MCEFKTLCSLTFSVVLQVAVARGHPGIASKNYKDTLEQSHVENELYKLGLNLPNPMFVTRTVKELCTIFHKS